MIFKQTQLFVFLSVFSLTCLLQSCLIDKEEEDSGPPPKYILLLNPWQGMTGGTPKIHGAFNGWDKDAMEQVDPCGWYSYVTTNPQGMGQFRFLKGGFWDAENSFGRGGLGSEVNFTLGTLLDEKDTVWVWLNEGGTGSISNVQPLIEGCGGSAPEKPAAGSALYPFPQEANYGLGLKPTYYAWYEVQQLYEIWKGLHFEASGDLARVKFEDPALTVSEGIAYGMLISVFMDNAANNTRGDFDKLWNYYKKFSGSNGLMHWQIKGFDDVWESGAATDAELDAAVALILAARQWGDAAYLDEAKSLLGNIVAYEISENGLLKPGSEWDDVRNPSYFSFVAFSMFASLMPDQADYWGSAIELHYSHINSAAHGSTGLVPNWTSDAGAAANPGTGYKDWEYFGFDAIRTPWRAAWAYLWYGHEQGQSIATKVCNWSASATGGDPNNIRSMYTLDGKAHGDHTHYTAGPAFTGAYATACMTSDNQAYLDALYSQLKSQIGEDNSLYYHSSLQVLYALLLTGNMPNMYLY